MRAIFELGVGAMQSALHLKSLNATIAVGFGGYPSVPTVRAAAFLGIPVILHEQNAVLGRANRFLAPHARKIATSFREMTTLSDGETTKCHFTGNPVRPAVLEMRGAKAHTGDSHFNLLVFGGSQGATVFSTIVPEAIAGIPEDLLPRLRITQQSRAEDVEPVKARYRALGVTADVRPFFDDLPERMASADLVIARSGASPSLNCRPLGALLFWFPIRVPQTITRPPTPCPQATGAAWMMSEPDEFTAGKLAGFLPGLLKTPDRLQRAADAARAAGTPDAANHLADLVVAAAPALSAATASVQQGSAA